MNKRSYVLLVSLILLLTFMLNGCMLSDRTSGTVDEGDVYNVEINGAVSSEVAAASKAVMSAVSVSSVYKYTTIGGMKTASSSGSGVIYKMNDERTDAYVVTNYHVVYNSSLGISKNICVYLYGMESSECAISAEYIGGSMYYDIAVLKITGSQILRGSSAVSATFADSDTLNILDTVIAVGNASGSGLSATVGHLNVDSEYITLYGADDKTKITLRVMRTDAAVNPGNSGGGLFNTKGEVVGIVNAKSADDSIDNIGYAIPSNVATSIVDNIIYYCDNTDKTCVYRCILGVTLGARNPGTSYDSESGTVRKYEDVYISSVTSGSPAENVFKVDDIVKKITVADKTYEITRQFQLIDAMLDVREGMIATFEVQRGENTVTFSITATEDMLEAYV